MGSCNGNSSSSYYSRSKNAEHTSKPFRKFLYWFVFVIDQYCISNITPCGINGILTPESQIRMVEVGACSTPCGINGILTSSWQTPHTGIECSTPCGIN